MSKHPSTDGPKNLSLWFVGILSVFMLALTPAALHAECPSEINGGCTQWCDYSSAGGGCTGIECSPQSEDSCWNENYYSYSESESGPYGVCNVQCGYFIWFTCSCV